MPGGERESRSSPVFRRPPALPPAYPRLLPVLSAPTETGWFRVRCCALPNPMCLGRMRSFVVGSVCSRGSCIAVEA